VSDLLVRPKRRAQDDARIVDVDPVRVGWSYVGFEVLALQPGELVERATRECEACVVLIAGTVRLGCDGHDFGLVGGRAHPWAGPPDAAYLPPGSALEMAAQSQGAEVAICWAPAVGRGRARLLPGREVRPEARGRSAHARTIHPILMAEREAEALLVCEVLTPAGHWSSYPPHKHDRDAMPSESLLEETYYHRLSPPNGFALQRVYTDDGELDETVTVHDRDCVLVPRGYHTVSAPPGYDLYYLNVMAGPVRAWAIANDPNHAWVAERPAEVATGSEA
jgi:5-deoxy-glucuronate isomerase